MLRFETLIFLVVNYALLIQAISFQDDTTLTKQQALALQKFKNRMVPVLEQDFMKGDLFLLRFLRAKNFDVSRAEEFLNTHLKWRKDNKMETIHDEDWSDMEKDYVYKIDAIDFDGRPWIQWDLGEWDVRKAAVSGKLSRLIRYSNKMWEEATVKVREFQSQGKNVTRWTMILDLTHINAVQNVNAASFPYYLSLTASLEGNFAGTVDEIHLINTPAIFETVLALTRPLLTEGTRNGLKVYNKNEETWGPIIRSKVDPSYLPTNYGGTLKAN